MKSFFALLFSAALANDCFKADVDYKYQTFREFTGVTSAEECAELCRQAKDSGCLFASYDNDDLECELKRAGYASRREGYTSIDVRCLYPEEYPAPLGGPNPLYTPFRLESKYHCGDHDMCGYVMNVDGTGRVKLSLGDGVHWRLEKSGDSFAFKAATCSDNAPACGKYVCAQDSDLYVCDANDERIVYFEKHDNGNTSAFRDVQSRKWLRLDGEFLGLSSAGIAPYRLVFDTHRPKIDCGDGSSVSKVALQLMHVYDNSASYATFKNRWASQYNRLMLELSEKFSKVDVGLTSFIDKPRPGYSEDVNFDGTNFTYGYRLESNLESSYEDFRGAMLDLVSPVGGYDRPENSLDALGWTVRDGNVEWKNGDFDEDGNLIVRVLVVSTDNLFKTSHPQISSVLPGCDLSKEQVPDVTDMCSEEQVAELIRAKRGRVFAMLSGSDETHEAWTGLSDRFNAAGVPMSVHRQELNGNNMVDNVITGISNSLCLLRPEPESPTSSTSTTKPSCYQSGVSLPQVELRRFEGIATREMCTRLCMRTAECRFVNYNVFSQDCSLHSTNDGAFADDESYVVASMECLGGGRVDGMETSTTTTTTTTTIGYTGPVTTRPAAEVTVGPDGSCFNPGVRIFKHTVRVATDVADIQVCANLCARTYECRFITYRKRNKRCWMLKTDSGAAEVDKSYVSASLECLNGGRGGGFGTDGSIPTPPSKESDKDSGSAKDSDDVYGKISGDDLTTQGRDNSLLTVPTTQGRDNSLLTVPTTQGRDNSLLTVPTTQGRDNSLLTVPTTQGRDNSLLTVPESVCPAEIVDSCLETVVSERETVEIVANVPDVGACARLCCERHPECRDVDYSPESQDCQLNIKVVVEDSVRVDMECALRQRRL